MISSGQPSDEIGRSRHLDELFADEPFLSPTMKARQMHEKMLELRLSQGAANERPAQSLQDIEANVRQQPVAISTPPARKHSGVPKMNFDEARAILRGHGVPDQYGFDPTDPLSYFRTQVLSQWLQKVEPREINRPDPGFSPNSTMPSSELRSELNGTPNSEDRTD